jgi:hypothetical protein
LLGRSRWRFLYHATTTFTLAVLLAGCAQSASGAPHAATPTRTSAPTPTPLPPAPLTWRKAAALPEGIFPWVAPSDGATAYICAEPSVDTSSGVIVRPHVYFTHDVGAHWERKANIPADHVNSQCMLEIDQLNPAIVVAILIWMPNGAGGGPSITDTTNYVTFNSGVSWRKLTDPRPFMMDSTPSATWNGITYAIRGVLAGNAVHNGIWASSDHMATWRLVDPPGITVDAETIWLAPATGEILAVYGIPAEPGATLWDTRDGGAHWTQLNTPESMSSNSAMRPYLAWSPGPNKPWTICNTDVGVTADDRSGYFPLFCSFDGGKTWTSRPNINPVVRAENNPQELGRVFAIAGDSSLLANLSNSSTVTIYRLAPGASQWQSLGDTPDTLSVSFLATPGSANPNGDVVWTGPYFALGFATHH